MTSTRAASEFSSDDATPDFVLAPFWEDVDIRRGGFIQFEVFYNFNDSTRLTQVSSFIRAQLNLAEFDGVGMIVVEWNAVSHFSTGVLGVSLFVIYYG